VAGLHKAADLAKLGVQRLSAGSGISQIVWQRIAKLTEAFLTTGDSERFTRDFMEYGELQKLFANTR
jgi:2-methylisocitrate lyase-like PEP mutase family enzyme